MALVNGLGEDTGIRTVKRDKKGIISCGHVNASWETFISA